MRSPCRGRGAIVNRYRQRYRNRWRRSGSRRSRWPSDDPGRGRAGRRLDRDRVQGGQRSVRGGREHGGPGPGRHRRARVRVEPGGAEPAQPPHPRDRHPGGRLRAVQRRAAQGRGAGRSTAPGTSWWPTRAAAAAAPSVGWERRYLSRLSGTLIDGAVLVTPTRRGRRRTAPPSSRSTRTPAPRGCPPSTPTTCAARVMAIEYLIALGHRRIGFLGGRPDLESARLRELGFREALAAAGIPVDPALVRVGDYRPETAVEPARAAALAAPDAAHGRSSPPTTCRPSQTTRVAGRWACPCPATCRSSGSTTSPSPR